ncbi:hypothetical protein [Marinospirillum sp.]|uniref:hypothetical protein n=1 Tax=Marinospirillum sp. TaxID=2183934 RepID=UPI00286FEC6A|nr:hypothetical protein [Marinospirillum sp.]MDR9468484.1 hypothetical protein [Marinospirillum sp.]
MKPLVFLLLLLVFPLGASGNQVAAEYQSAYESYQAAVADDYSAGRIAATWKDLHQSQPDDPLPLLLLGASQVLKGRDAWMPWNKLRYTEEGMEQMTAALKLLNTEDQERYLDGLPVGVLLPALAGITFIEVPGFFGRFEQGYQLLQEASSSSLLKGIPAENQAFIHQYLYQAASEVDESRMKELAVQRLQSLGIEEVAP